MRMLFTYLERNADFHVHLIAPDVADFLYIEVPWAKNNSLASSADASNTTNSRIANEEYDPVKAYNQYKLDPRITEAWKCWLSLRGMTVKTFLRSQHSYCKLQKAIKDAEEAVVPKSASGDKIKFSNSEHTRAEQLLEELDMTRTAESGKKVGRDWAKEEIIQGRTPTKANLRFECHMLTDRFGPYSNKESTLLADIDDSILTDSICPEIADQIPEANKTIFVDNLPIDIDEDELTDLYSRCGEIESIEIFNLKPELDPGELTASALKELKKKRRMTGVKGTRYTRQRTPVYAIVTFKDEDGFKRGSIDMLRIFGMVIRRHAAKSYPARSVHKLYIENIPDGLYALDIEEKLSKLLHPDMYISLEIGQHVNSQPKNSVLSFPSYEVAHLAYEKLRIMDFGSEECTVNWMATPKDSMLHWTRKISPDP